MASIAGLSGSTTLNGAGCWLRSIDLSGVAISTPDADEPWKHRGVTLISPLHAMAAAHFVDHNPGWRVVFLGNDGIEYTRTVAALTDLDPDATDCMAVTFDNPLPASVVPLRLPTDDWLLQSGLPVAWVDQALGAFRIDVDIYAATTVLTNATGSLAKPAGVVGGDSSSPVIALYGTLPVFLGCVHYQSPTASGSCMIGALPMITAILAAAGYTSAPLPPLS